jgi:RNA polymerase sigma-70 factor (ECF subfamily)
MYRVALNVGISSLRRRGHPARRALSLDASQEPASEDNANDAEQIVLLRCMIRDLGPLDRALLILWLDDLSHLDIAEVLGLSASNVATKLHRMKAHLRQRMTESEETTHYHGRKTR